MHISNKAAHSVLTCQTSNTHSMHMSNKQHTVCTCQTKQLTQYAHVKQATHTVCTCQTSNTHTVCTCQTKQHPQYAHIKQSNTHSLNMSDKTAQSIAHWYSLYWSVRSKYRQLTYCFMLFWNLGLSTLLLLFTCWLVVLLADCLEMTLCGWPDEKIQLLANCLFVVLIWLLIMCVLPSSIDDPVQLTGLENLRTKFVSFFFLFFFFFLYFIHMSRILSYFFVSFFFFLFFFLLLQSYYVQILGFIHMCGFCLPSYRDVSRLDQLKGVRRARTKKFHIVSEKWVKACLEDGGLHPEKTFEFWNHRHT